MSPEQVMGASLDGRSDQFSLAAVAYQVLTGSTLFGQQAVATLAYKIVHETAVRTDSKRLVAPGSRRGALGSTL
jgi:serine/threonine-protein kinase